METGKVVQMQAKGVNDHQHIDINRLEQYWKSSTPMTEEGTQIKIMHLELIDLVKETGFLGSIESARKELEDENILHKEQ
jgi:hypothetical protein